MITNIDGLTFSLSRVRKPKTRSYVRSNWGQRKRIKLALAGSIAEVLGHDVNENIFFLFMGRQGFG